MAINGASAVVGAIQVILGLQSPVPGPPSPIITKLQTEIPVMQDPVMTEQKDSYLGWFSEIWSYLYVMGILLRVLPVIGIFTLFIFVLIRILQLLNRWLCRLTGMPSLAFLQNLPPPPVYNQNTNFKIWL